MSNHNINSKLKEEIRKKRGNKCEDCGQANGPKDSPLDRLQLHHEIPLWCGGTNKQSNLKLLCQKCHDKAHMKHYRLKLEKMKKTFKELKKSDKYRSDTVC